MTIRQIIGDNVRSCRHKLKWSQQKLGTETGLHHDYIGRLERGLENVSADNLAKIAAAFKTDTANLLIENFFLDGKMETSLDGKKDGKPDHKQNGKLDGQQADKLDGKLVAKKEQKKS